jgi:predicted DNA-binding transcriptional regulator YafY
MNSPHPLPKEQIFELLPAYRNAAQSRQALKRMFARNKELIRKLGCNLVVNEVDGDFEYQIRATANSSYITVTNWESSLINSISRIWTDDEIGDAVERATRKLLPVSGSNERLINTKNEPLVDVFAKLKVIGKYSRTIVQAISENKALTMQYLNKLVDIYPLQLMYANNNWYLLAVDDTAQEKLKTYKIERIVQINQVYDCNNALKRSLTKCTCLRRRTTSRTNSVVIKRLLV